MISKRIWYLSIWHHVCVIVNNASGQTCWVKVIGIIKKWQSFLNLRDCFSLWVCLSPTNLLPTERNTTSNELIIVLRLSWDVSMTSYVEMKYYYVISTASLVKFLRSTVSHTIKPAASLRKKRQLVWTRQFWKIHRKMLSSAWLVIIAVFRYVICLIL